MVGEGGGLCMSGGVGGGMCAYILYHKSMDSRLSTHWHYIFKSVYTLTDMFSLQNIFFFFLLFFPF